MLKSLDRTAARLFAPAYAHAARRLFAACAMMLALASCLVLSGCSGGCSRTPDEKPAPIVDRTKDPEYAKTIRDRLDLQRETASRSHAILKELEAARAENPESEKTKELEKRHAEVVAELEKQRIVNMAIVRERIEKERADRRQATEEAKGKVK